MYNAAKDIDTALIQVILTDSLRWDFFCFDFSTMQVYRGQTAHIYGYKSNGDIHLLVPPSEQDHDHIFRLKAVDNPFFQPRIMGIKLTIF